MAVLDIQLPTLHPGQVAAYRLMQQHKQVVLRCGRRWGKTDFGKTLAADGSLKGWPIGWFAPDYKIQIEAYNEIVETLEPAIRTSSKTEGVIRTINRGRIDFWTLENERAGRSRKYKLVVVDEAAFTKPNMIEIWERSIQPTLLDLSGSALVMSNTNGRDEENFLWRVCNQPEHGFKEYWAPTHQNPYLPAGDLEKLIKEKPPLVYQQEYLAEFVDWSGVQFFNQEDLLVDGKPVPMPTLCDGIFAVLDTAVKDGKQHDSTGITYFSVSKSYGHQVVILDWDVIQIEGASLERWLPTVFNRLTELTKQCKARMGSMGAFIEDKASGTILLQQARNNGWPAIAIDSKLTAAGKDGRALNVSGYVYQKKVKLSEQAYNKVTTLKGITRNHLLAQVLNFRIGRKEGHADDLLDTFCYGISLALGNAEGY